ncbi:TAXI family TRAP transporter solute-binding subunit [Dactylosporangium sp. NPDC049525]|uniref:TAXI family TRAP transporter solute-binding subunit n=1 Tax=Dactylosporangium sp. NPDC049525 TaxID=3154730 RepID=UPI003419909D
MSATDESDRIDVRPTSKLRFRGDWGAVNLTRACGWLANWVWAQTADHRLSVIHTGRGMGDNLRALADGEVDVAVVTPACFAQLAVEGRGPFREHPMPQLRAIARLPHRDAMLFTGRAELGIRSLTQLAAERPALRLSIGTDDPDGFMGLGAQIVLGSAGITLDDIRKWGGDVRHHEEPFGCIDDLHTGAADVIISEAIMTQNWQNLCHDVPVTFVGLEPHELRRIETEWGLGSVTVPAGYLPGMTSDVTTLDYADWLIVTTAELPDEVAALLARAVVEAPGPFEMQYRHLPVERSPLTYPIAVSHAASTTIPLHPAAAEIYRSASVA